MLRSPTTATLTVLQDRPPWQECPRARACR
jgi:hypothetical protein